MLPNCIHNSQFKFSEELAETREVAAVAKVSSFVIDDLKNLTSSLSLLLENASDFIGEPEFQEDMLQAVRNTVDKMRGLTQKLKEIPEKESLNTMITDIDLLVKESVAEFRKVRPGVDLHYHGTTVLSMTDSEEMKKVLLNILLNAVDATDNNCVIRVETGNADDMAFVHVEDNGCGMTRDFVSNHLFRPFRTTKEKGLGIGLYQSKQIVEAHCGSIEVKSEVGKGSVFTIYVPVANGG